MANIVCVYRHHPMTVARFFKKAFRDLGHTVISCGYSTGASIPWGSQYYFPEYADEPTIPLEQDSPIANLDWLHQRLDELGFMPDVVIQFDAGFWFKRNSIPSYPMIHVGTDPHALSYEQQRLQSNVFINMQSAYSKEGDQWVPYAFDPQAHYYTPMPQNYDICFIGNLSTPTRKNTIEWLKTNYNVFSDVGLLFEPCNDMYNQARIGFNVSSEQDLPMRFWEDMARRRLVVTNRVPDLMDLACKEDQHYVAYSSVPELKEKLDYYLSHPDEAERIAATGWVWVHETRQTYVQRAQQILQSVNIQ